MTDDDIPIEAKMQNSDAYLNGHFVNDEEISYVHEDAIGEHPIFQQFAGMEPATISPNTSQSKSRWEDTRSPNYAPSWSPASAPSAGSSSLENYDPQSVKEEYFNAMTTAHFNTYFNNRNVYVPPEDPKKAEMNPDINVSVSTVVKALTGISKRKEKYFEQEYVDDVFVFIDTLEDMEAFAPIAMKWPAIGGRIKLNLRNLVMEWEGGTFMTKKEEAWKFEIAEIIELIGDEFKLTKDKFRNRVLAKKPLPLHTLERDQLAEERKRNPKGQHAPRIPADLKTLKHRDGWKIEISCDSVLLNQQSQQLQVWGDIGQLTTLWRHYAGFPESEILFSHRGSESDEGEETDGMLM